MAKRERGANFSIREIELLTDLVVKYQNVVENKKTDAVTWRQKELQWEKISDEFNAAGFVRSARNLQSKYECLKKKLRKDAAERKMQLYATGGGPPPKFKDLEPWEAKLAPLLSLSVCGLEPLFDSDEVEVEVEIIEDTVGLPTEESAIIMDSIPCTSSVIPCTSSVIPSQPVDGWTAFSPSQLRTPMHSALKVQHERDVEVPSDAVRPSTRETNEQDRRKIRNLKSSHSSLLQAKLDFISLQTKILKQQDRRHLLAHRAQERRLLLAHRAQERRNILEHKARMRLLKARLMAAKKRLI